MTRAAFASLLAVVALGCGERARDEAVAAPMIPVSSDEIVATVDGRPIFAGAVAQQARARGVDARTALADLIDAEVLAGAAHARGLDRSLEAQLAARGALARRFLQEGFEKEVTPANVPMELVRKFFMRNQPYLNHDEYVDVWHILVLTHKDFTDEQRAAARAYASELAKRGKGKTVDEFKALATEAHAAGRTDVDDAHEVVTERDGWTQKSFSHGAFDQLKKPGDTCVVETSFGAHALYLVRYLPPVHTPLEKAEPELRRGVFASEFQKREFARVMDELMTRHKIELHQDRIPKDEP
jgi:hypothetical protein